MAKFKGVLTFDTEKCKGCSLCVQACPFDLLELDMETLNKKGYHIAHIMYPEKCTACQSCALMCPDLVISIDRVEVGGHNG